MLPHRSGIRIDARRRSFLGVKSSIPTVSNIEAELLRDRPLAALPLAWKHVFRGSCDDFGVRVWLDSKGEIT